MQNPIDHLKRRKKPNFRVIISVLILALLVTSAGTALASRLDLSSSSEAKPSINQIRAGIPEEEGSSEVIPDSYENSAPFQQFGKNMNTIYTTGGIGAAVLVLLAYLRIASGDSKLIKTPLKDSNLFKIRRAARTEIADQEKIKARRIRLLTAAPILGITFAELLIFSGRIGIAVWIHIAIVIILSLSDIFLKDPETHKIYQAFMLLPVLRLVNLSMPIFFNTTLYTFIFVYGPLAIPVAIIIMHHRDSLEQIGITLKHIIPYMIISVPLSFLLGLGEYLTIRSGYLIPDLAFGNLLKLTIVMVFFVGLIEELIFRSILQTRLEHALSVWEALLITSILFGLMHSGYGTFQEILYTGFVGLIMGLAFYKTKSLPFIAVLHGFVNVFLFGILPHQLNVWPGL